MILTMIDDFFSATHIPKQTLFFLKKKGINPVYDRVDKQGWYISYLTKRMIDMYRHALELTAIKKEY